MEQLARDVGAPAAAENIVKQVGKEVREPVRLHPNPRARGRSFHQFHGVRLQFRALASLTAARFALSPRQLHRLQSSSV